MQKKSSNGDTSTKSNKQTVRSEINLRLETADSGVSTTKELLESNKVAGKAGESSDNCPMEYDQEPPRKVLAYMRTACCDSGRCLENQRDKILQYAKDRGLSISKFVEVEAVPGRSSIEARKIDELMDELKPGSILIVTDSARLSRDSAECMRILSDLASKKVNVIFCHDA